MFFIFANSKTTKIKKNNKKHFTFSNSGKKGFGKPMLMC